MSPDTPISLDLLGITKVYASAVALNGVSLSIRGGEVVGLIGENGAGKSTLMKVLGGTIAPDEGEMVIDGVPLMALTPAAAVAHGIAFVHQELNPFVNLDVAGNVLLGREIRSGPFGFVDRKAMESRVRPLLELLGTRFTASTAVSELSLADQQLLEIAKALSINVRLLILDEPTSSLTLAETQRLLAVIRRLRDEGVAVLFITHRLNEVEEVADRVVGLRDGCNAGDLPREGITKDAMVRLMIGRDVKQFYVPPDRQEGAVVLKTIGLRTQTYPDAAVDLQVRSGEIMGLAGLVGAGRTELARALFGIDPVLSGQVEIAGRAVEPGSVRAAIAAGICLVPEDRKTEGLFLDFSIAGNVIMPRLDAVARHRFIDEGAELRVAEDFRERLSIKARRLDRPVGELSGGNQQKVVLAKWLGLKPRLIILDEPTRGIDVGAKAEVYRLMRTLAAEGAAILMISSDMEEVIGVSTRVAVMRRGVIAGVLEREDVSEEAVLRLAVE
ncbi:D-ribose transporter ATP-binding protein [Rhizobium sp. Root274]|uniref:sugar ABC transporter ATP-binding protein n=1 Tax=unclassified Rhizobium TaxID=2613769 RepID=UPI00071304ED|nr:MULTISPECIES: sugar ABC transporter ATP-binding protein [unclassified Rhizobium]KQW29662.1 D-ribose transporter ATP-binding protein [Rhizobium sp. Root1240]KRD29852.1 D-ribose transporter ATP-binding protein [Rhizobium sp. Root274]